jgi:hypothetical protein
MAVKRWNGTAWEVYAGADLAPVKVTDGRVGKTTFIGATSPTGQVDGDIWIDQDTTTNAVVPTALTTKGDMFAATANAAYTRFAAGNNGESLYADSTTSTGLRWQGDFNTGKNKILNGDFSIWQRGTTATSTSGFLNVTYLADRWTTYYYGGGNTANYTYSRENLPYGDIPGYGGQYFARHAFPAYSSTAYWEWIHKIEDVRTLAGQINTLSFWVRVPSGTPPTISWEVMQNFGTGGSTSVYSYTGFSSTTLTSSWQRMTLPLNIASVAGKTIGAGSYLQIKAYFGPTGSSGSAFTLDITGMQLEQSSVATPFTTNTANPQAELAACQRYYYKSVDMSVVPGSATFSGLVRGGTNASGNRWIGHFSLPVTMRSAPSCIVYNPTTGAAGSMRNEDANTNVTVSGIFGQYQNTITQIDFSPVTSANNVVVGYIVASAEL